MAGAGTEEYSIDGAFLLKIQWLQKLTIQSPWWGDLEAVKNMEQESIGTQTPHQEL